MKSVLLWILLFCCTLQVYAQSTGSRCGNREYMEQRLREDTGYATRLALIEQQYEQYKLQAGAGKTNVGPIIIPVVFHVIYNTPEQNIPDYRIYEQLDALNRDFRRKNADSVNTPEAWRHLAVDCEIEFRFALRDPQGKATNGITRTNTPIPAFPFNNQMKYTSKGGKDAWDRDRYLNIWVCNLDVVYGFTPFPGEKPETDGVTLRYNVVGISNTPFPTDYGRTGTHEVGHWLNLRHVWGDDPGCDSSDRVFDTPNQTNYTFGSPDFPKTDACQPMEPGIMFMNYMDYTDDRAMNMFTQGQKLRMHAVLNPLTGIRKSLLSSDAWQPLTGIEEPGGIAESQLSIYPNPVEGPLNVALDLNRPYAVTLSLSNILGQQRQVKLDSFSGGIYSMSTDGLAPGFYILHVQIDGQVLSRKVLIR